jgi:glycosyltransferase involved in cell wall biosynthesis
VVTLRRDLANEYTLSPMTRVLRLGLIEEKNPFWQLGHAARLWALRRALIGLQPDVVISFIDKLNAAVVGALIGSGIPVIATEHLTPWRNSLGFWWELVRRVAYRNATIVISPTHSITKWFAQQMDGRFMTIPYPAMDVARAENVARELLILGAGRLTTEKGFDLLIEGFSRVAMEFPNWRLEIAGDGPERRNLEKLISQLNMQSRIKLVGHIADLQFHYARAEVFALSSRHEAYPMVLVEAMRAGCCIVATDCAAGVRSILQDGSSGLLFRPNDVVALSLALERVMSLSDLRHALTRNGVNRGAELVSSEIMPLWDRTLNSVLG